MAGVTKRIQQMVDKMYDTIRLHFVCVVFEKLINLQFLKYSIEKFYFFHSMDYSK